jgi:hypothetical protein
MKACVALLGVITLATGIVPVHAAEITDITPCSALVEVMDSENLERIRQYGYYIFNVMDTMDIDHVQRGEPGIMSQMSDAGKTNLFAATSVQCRNHPNMTVYNSAALVYRGTRDIEIQFGKVKWEAAVAYIRPPAAPPPTFLSPHHVCYCGQRGSECLA